MKKKEHKPRIVYYDDEKNNDFANIEITRKQVKHNYRYVSYNPISHFFGWLVRYFIAIPVLTLTNFFCYHTAIKNRKVLRSVRKKGYYLYANHVVEFDPIIHPVLINPIKYCVAIAGPEAFSINFCVSWLVKALGAIPIPNKNDMRMYMEYVKCLSHHIKMRHRILIYPEAHIWPYYTGIRDFSHSSFRYPVNDNAPVIVATTVFKQRKHHKKPKPVVYLDGPYYPNKELNNHDRVDELALRVRETMLKRSQVEWNYAYIQYLERETSEEKLPD